MFHRFRRIAIACPCVLAVAGCGTGASPHPSAAQMRTLRSHLADARAAVGRQDAAAAATALNAIAVEVSRLRRRGELSQAFASTLRTEVRQARARVRTELPAAPSAPLASPAPVTGDAQAAGPGPPLGKDKGPKDKGPKDKGPKDKGNGDGGGGGGD